MDGRNVELLSKSITELSSNRDIKKLAGILIHLAYNPEVLKNSEYREKIKTVLTNPNFVKFAAQYGIASLKEYTKENYSLIEDILKHPNVMNDTVDYGVLMLSERGVASKNALNLLKGPEFKETLRNKLDGFVNRDKQAQKKAKKLAKHHQVLFRIYIRR